MGRVLHRHDSYAQDSGERQLQQNVKDAYTFCSPKEKGQMAIMPIGIVKHMLVSRLTQYL